MIKKVTPLKEPELTQLCDLWLDTNKQAHDFIPATYWQHNYELVKGLFPQAQIYGYYEEGSLIAFIGLIETYIAGIFVHPKRQGDGIGTQLLDVAQQEATTLSLHVYKQNKQALAFYLSKGFIIAEESVDEATGEAEYLMTWHS